MLAKHLPLACCGALALLWGGSALFPRSEAQDPGTLARVGERAITAEDMAGRGAYRFDLAFQLDDPQGERTALRDAVEEELLLQEALRRGLEREDVVARRRLAMRLVEDEVIAPASFEVTEAAVRAHYDAHPERYEGPQGPIPFERVAARVKGDLLQQVLARRYEELIGRLWQASEVDAPTLAAAAVRSSGEACCPD